jgi:hypothetical protein
MTVSLGIRLPPPSLPDGRPIGGIHPPADWRSTTDPVVSVEGIPS